MGRLHGTWLPLALLSDRGHSEPQSPHLHGSPGPPRGVAQALVALFSGLRDSHFRALLEGSGAARKLPDASGKSMDAC